MRSVNDIMISLLEDENQKVEFNFNLAQRMNYEDSRRMKRNAQILKTARKNCVPLKDKEILDRFCPNMKEEFGIGIDKATASFYCVRPNMIHIKVKAIIAITEDSHYLTIHSKSAEVTFFKDFLVTSIRIVS